MNRVMNLHGKCLCSLVVAAALLLCFGLTAVAKKPKLEPEELVRHHLESLGLSDGRVVRNSCQADGNGALTILRGGGGRASGTGKVSIRRPQNSKVHIVQ